MPVLAQLIAVHREGLAQGSRVVELLCGGDAFGCPLGSQIEPLFGEDRAEADSQAGPCTTEYSERVSLKVAIGGSRFEASD